MVMNKEGIATLIIPNDPKLDKIVSPIEEIGITKWQLIAIPEISASESTSDGKKKLDSVVVYCNPDKIGQIWFCIAYLKLLVTSESNEEIYYDYAYEYFDASNAEWKFKIQKKTNRFCKSEVVLQNPNNESIKVQLLISLKKMSPNVETASNVVLVIGSNRIKVMKMFLSVVSPVFHALFYSGFKEETQEEIEIKDVDFYEFLELLLVLITDKNVDERNVIFLLQLGDRFDIEVLRQRCEEFLISTSDIEKNVKSALADEYNLKKLAKKCIESDEVRWEKIAFRYNSPCPNCSLIQNALE